MRGTLPSSDLSSSPTASTRNCAAGDVGRMVGASVGVGVGTSVGVGAVVGRGESVLGSAAA